MRSGTLGKEAASLPRKWYGALKVKVDLRGTERSVAARRRKRCKFYLPCAYHVILLLPLLIPLRRCAFRSVVTVVFTYLPPFFDGCQSDIVTGKHQGNDLNTDEPQAAECKCCFDDHATSDVIFHFQKL